MFGEILKQISSIWQRFSPLQKGIGLGAMILSFLLFVVAAPEEKPQKEVAQATEPKGFELFDSNTWIKGEKELQVLELRALKGQLEKEIEKFEAIQTASVILDKGGTKTLGDPLVKPKASVIVALKEGKTLSPSTVAAITCHLVGGVRGLEPEAISISSTSGRVYKGPDAITPLIEEERIEIALKETLHKVLGDSPFHLTFTIEGLSLFLDKEREGFSSKEVLSLCKAICPPSLPIHLHFLSFPKKKSVSKAPFHLPLYYFTPFAFLPLLLLLKKKEKERGS